LNTALGYPAQTGPTRLRSRWYAPTRG
jgi:hypothetical protein